MTARNDMIPKDAVLPWLLQCENMYEPYQMPWRTRPTGFVGPYGEGGRSVMDPFPQRLEDEAEAKATLGIFQSATTVNLQYAGAAKKLQLPKLTRPEAQHSQPVLFTGTATTVAFWQSLRRGRRACEIICSSRGFICRLCLGTYCSDVSATHNSGTNFKYVYLN